MSAAAKTSTKNAKATNHSPKASGLLQRKCACGGAMGLTGVCTQCGSKMLQRKLMVGASNDPLELEADRVADQVMAMTPRDGVSNSPLRIQRATGQSAGDAGTAPASVDRVLAGTGRPLDPALQQDMGHRFGYNFSGVRIHTGTEAARSAQDVNAQAYTVGRNIVFGAGQFAPTSRAGQSLIAHELAHVVQQRGATKVVRRKKLKSPYSAEIVAAKDSHGRAWVYKDQAAHGARANVLTPGMRVTITDEFHHGDWLFAQDLPEAAVKVLRRSWGNLPTGRMGVYLPAKYVKRLPSNNPASPTSPKTGIKPLNPPDGRDQEVVNYYLRGNPQNRVNYYLPQAQSASPASSKKAAPLELALNKQTKGTGHSKNPLNIEIKRPNVGNMMHVHSDEFPWDLGKYLKREDEGPFKYFKIEASISGGAIFEPDSDVDGEPTVNVGSTVSAHGAGVELDMDNLSHECKSALLGFRITQWGGKWNYALANDELDIIYMIEAEAYWKYFNKLKAKFHGAFNFAKVKWDDLKNNPDEMKIAELEVGAALGGKFNFNLPGPIDGSVDLDIEINFGLSPRWPHILELVMKKLAEKGATDAEEVSGTVDSAAADADLVTTGTDAAAADADLVTTGTDAAAADTGAGETFMGSLALDLAALGAALLSIPAMFHGFQVGSKDTTASLAADYAGEKIKRESKAYAEASARTLNGRHAKGQGALDANVIIAEYMVTHHMNRAQACKVLATKAPYLKLKPILYKLLLKSAYKKACKSFDTEYANQFGFLKGGGGMKSQFRETLALNLGIKMPEIHHAQLSFWPYWVKPMRTLFK